MTASLSAVTVRVPVAVIAVHAARKAANLLVHDPAPTLPSKRSFFHLGNEIKSPLGQAHRAEVRKGPSAKGDLGRPATPHSSQHSEGTYFPRGKKTRRPR